MKITPLALPEVLLLQPTRHEDARGWFAETWRQDELDAAVGAPVRFVMAAQSHSRRHVLRGLHYQADPHAQGKLVGVAVGAVFDVAVDVREGSATRGQWVAAELSAANGRRMWVPPGFAHGFLVLSDEALCQYQTTAPWVPQAERTLRWDDPAVGVAWPLRGRSPVLSARDAAAP